MPIFSLKAGLGSSFNEAPKRKLAIPPPAASEQPDDGLMRIRGSGSQVINSSHSRSASFSRQVAKETKRTYDEVRIKNPDDNSQYVDVQRPFKTNMQTPNTRGVFDPWQVQFWAPTYTTIVYAKQPEQDNVEVIQENIKIKNPAYGKVITI